MIERFSELLDKWLPPRTHPQYHVYRSYELKAVERGQAALEEVRQHTDIGGKLILDVGCGTGGISVAFAKEGGRVIGINSGGTKPLTMRLRLARARARDEKADVAFICCDAQRLPFRDGAFDVIICNDVIEHVHRPNELASEVSKALKPEGTLYLTAPNRFSPTNIYKDSHYGLFGVALLPRWLARTYITRIKRREKNYSVSHIPTYRSLVKMFEREGVHLTLSTGNVHSLLHNPASIEDSGYRRIGVLRKRLRLERIAGRLLPSHTFAANFVFTGRRR